MPRNTHPGSPGLSEVSSGPAVRFFTGSLSPVMSDWSIISSFVRIIRPVGRDLVAHFQQHAVADDDVFERDGVDRCPFRVHLHADGVLRRVELLEFAVAAVLR